MQGQLRLALLAGLLLLVAAAALAADVQLSTEVSAKACKALRLTGLPRNASLSESVESSGPIQVILAREDDVQRFRKGLRPAFRVAPSCA